MAHIQISKKSVLMQVNISFFVRLKRRPLEVQLDVFRLASRMFACCADMGPPTGNRGAPGATSGPLFPSNMTLQESNWVGPIFICGFRVAAKLAFSDRPLTPRGPKKGQKGPFGATHAKNGIDRLEANGISVV